MMSNYTIISTIIYSSVIICMEAQKCHLCAWFELHSNHHFTAVWWMNYNSYSLMNCIIARIYTVHFDINSCAIFHLFYSYIIQANLNGVFITHTAALTHTSTSFSQLNVSPCIHNKPSTIGLHACIPCTMNYL